MPRSRVANLVGTISGTSLNVASITLSSGLDVSNQANNAYAQANLAYTQANNAYGQANLGYTQANTATTNAGNAHNQANNAYGQANLAYTAANNAVLKSGDTMTGQLNISTGGLLVTGNVNIDSGTLFVDTINDSIGIGTTNPARKLDVRGGMRLIQDAVPTTGALVIRQNVSDNVGGIIQFVNHLNTVEQGWISSETNGDLKFATLSSEKMRITSNGNVGFGTTSPSNFGGVNLNVNAPSSSTYASQLWVSGTYTMQALVNQTNGVMAIGSRSNHHFDLCTNDITRLTISNTGNVGIGTTLPGNSKLRLNHGSGYYGASYPIQTWAYANYQVVNLQHDGNVNPIFNTDADSQWGPTATMIWQYRGTEQMRLTSSGSVGIGTSSPSTKFHVSGGAIRLDNAFSFTWTGTGGWNGSTTGTQFFKFSDNHQYYDVYDGGHYFRRSGSNTSFVIDATGNVQISAAGTEERFLRIGSGRSGNGYSYLDIVGDATYGNGLRLIRVNTGPNAPSSIEHRGTGSLQFVTQEAGNMDFYTNGGNLRMRVSIDGNIGVGTTSIAAKLHVHNTNYGTGTVASLWQYSGSASSPTEVSDWPYPVLSLRSFGNFYLQTMLSFGLPNDADYKTDDSVWNFRLNGVTVSGWDNNSNTTPSIASSANVGLQLLGPGNLRLGTVNSKNIYFRTNNSDVVTIDGSGQVGIGTTSPSSRLHVYSATNNRAIFGSGSGINYLRLLSNNGGSNYGSAIEFIDGSTDSAQITSVVSGELRFSTAGAERIIINSLGNLLLGTTSGLGEGSRLDIITANAEADVTTWRYNNASAGKYWRWFIDSNSRLHCYNQSGAGVYMDDGATSWSGSSDERLKTDLKPIEDSVDKVCYLRAVTGRFKTDVEGTSRSFLIAQDVQKVFPEAVSDQNPDELGLRYNDIIPLLVASIKELKTELDSAKNRITELENK